MLAGSINTIVILYPQPRVSPSPKHTTQTPLTAPAAISTQAQLSSPHFRSSTMGVYTFVCRSAGGEWTAKQISGGDLEATASSTFDLQRKLVYAAALIDSSVGVQSSFSLVTPSSAVFQVIIGGGGGGGFISGCGAVTAGAPTGGSAAAEAPKEEEEKNVEKEESDEEEFGLSLFD
ncbi:hypothetical protein Droror1_Dr00026744 [Drosera rotundifolia]